MDSLSTHLKNIRVPCRQDNVYKDECVYSYDTPVSISARNLFLLNKYQTIELKCA